MQISIGDKIKDLRKRDRRKQDDLAAALGVSNQAVSRWESNKGYPDMELIPAIANYFHVTIDELFGYDNDRNVRLADCLKKADAMNKPGAVPTKRSVEELESFLREALGEFPNEWQLQFRLSVALQIKGSFVVDKDAKEKSLEEAASLLNQAQKNTDDPHWKDSIRLSLAGIYHQLGNSDRIEEMATESSPVYVCRELILTKTPDKKKSGLYHEKALLSLLHEAAFLVASGSADDQNTIPSDSEELCLSLIRVIENVLKGKKIGFFHSDLSFLYLCAFRLSARKGKEKESLRYFDEAYDHVLGFEEAWAKKEDEIFDYPGRIVFADKNTLKEQIALAPKEIADTIRNQPKYDLLFN